MAMQDITWTSFVDETDDLGNTALHIAVMHDQKTMVDWLMSHEAKRSMRTMNKHMVYTWLSTVLTSAI